MVNLKWVLSLVLIASLLVLSACGNNKVDTVQETSSNQVMETATAETTSDTSEQAIEVTDLAGNVVKLDKVPERVIALSAGDMEIVYALGGTVVGRTTVSDTVNPPEAEDVPELGNMMNLSLEKIASLNPDLIIAHQQLNAKSVPALKEMGVNVLLTGASTLDDIYKTIDIIGTVMQKNSEADTLIKKIEDKVKSVNKSENPVRALIVFGVSGNWMVALPNSLSGNLLEVAGGVNIAKDYPQLEKYSQYAQLNTERILEANPDAIFLISPGPAKVAMDSFTKEMENNPAWQSIDAVKNGHFVLLPNSLFGSNPGPRVVESIDFFIEELEKVKQ
ncbi:hypothetical protein LPB68_18100 [Paenibacillus crassostreae]|nr:hypothetical protein LPB68_18100 [Paenibacillus crassostreae]